MVIITYAPLRIFAETHTDALDAVDDWVRKTNAADWANPNEVRQTFNSADGVGNDRFVFNIKGNRYRLVAMIHFSVRTVYIRFIGTHSEYDDIDCATI
jgi:mRNA interferase HigB